MEHPDKHIVTYIQVSHPQYHLTDHQEGGLEGVIEGFWPPGTSNCAGENFHAITMAV